MSCYRQKAFMPTYITVSLRHKFHTDFHNFTFCSDSHVRPPDADTRGDDRGEVFFCPNAACIIPHQICNNIGREKLSVMGVAGKVCVCAGSD